VLPVVVTSVESAESLALQALLVSYFLKFLVCFLLNFVSSQLIAELAVLLLRMHICVLKITNRLLRST